MPDALLGVCRAIAFGNHPPVLRRAGLAGPCGSPPRVARSLPWPRLRRTTSFHEVVVSTGRRPARKERVSHRQASDKTYVATHGEGIPSVQHRPAVTPAARHAGVAARGAPRALRAGRGGGAGPPRHPRRVRGQGRSRPRGVRPDEDGGVAARLKRSHGSPLRSPSLASLPVVRSTIRRRRRGGALRDEGAEGARRAPRERPQQPALRAGCGYEGGGLCPTHS